MRSFIIVLQSHQLQTPWSPNISTKLHWSLWRHTAQPGPQAVIFLYASTSRSKMGFYLISLGNLYASPSSKVSFYFHHKISVTHRLSHFERTYTTFLGHAEKKCDLIFQKSYRAILNLLEQQCTEHWASPQGLVSSQDYSPKIESNNPSCI